jgi:hypothetical protein
VSKRTEGIISILAAFIVLFTAILDTVTAFIIAIIFFASFRAYHFKKSKK